MSSCTIPIETGLQPMIFLQVFAKGHHGYPQPEDEYYKVVYPNFCLRCGMHGQQAAPFRLKRTDGAPHSSFVQINWVFDAFFVHQEVARELASAGISGVSFGPVLNHRTGGELDNRVQLMISRTINCAETSRLPAATCEPDNEEHKVKFLGGRSRYNTLTPYCGGVKYHQPTSLAIKSDALDNAPDVFQTAEWFGSGGAADRLTLCSERFAELVSSSGWRGLEFRSVQANGWSERASQSI